MPETPTAVTAWKRAEDQCFQYLKQKMGSDYNKNAFLGEIPDDFDYVGEKGMWFFSLKGGGTPIDRQHNMGTPGGWSLFGFNAEWGGAFQTREEAMRMSGIFLQNMPLIEDSLKGVMRFQIETNPEITRLVMDKKSDLPTGGSIRLWAVLSECLVTFRAVVI